MLQTSKAPFHSDIARAPKGGIVSYRPADDGVRLRMGLWRTKSKKPKGTVYVGQGRTEFIEKFGPVFKRLNDLGYHAVAIDWRGQGLSERIHKNPVLGHVDKFSDYQYDVKALVDFAAEHDLDGPKYLIAHSMGGAIMLQAVLNGLDVKAALFSAPLWGIAVQGWQRQVLKLYVDTFGRFTSGLSRIPTMSDRNASITDGFEGNTLTTNEDEFHFRAKQLLAHPELEIAGPTVRWVIEALAACNSAKRKPDPGLPMLCLLAEHEAIVSNKAAHKLSQNWPSLDVIEFPNVHHELFIETEETQDAIWREIENFFAKH
ncbi:MAG: alpha/beta hydrolase [Pseudomonadota bacterium]